MLGKILCSRLLKNCRWNQSLSVDNFNEFRNKLHTSGLLRKKGPKEESLTPKDDELYVDPFDCEVEKRRQQAQCSILVQVQSEQSCGQLHDYCSQFGDIASLHHYTPSNSSMHFILVEFKNREVITNVLHACGHHERSQIIPTFSRMLWFRADQKKKMMSNTSKLSVPLTPGAPPLIRSQLLEWLRHSETVSDQIAMVHRATRLDDLGVRLRYVTAYQLEAAVQGLFPRARVELFGSSVNGFGRQGCDLDLVLQLDHRTEEEDASCRLMFHAKPSMNARSQTQRQIEGLADLVQWFLPGCTDVRRILLARVPIVKFRQELTDIECDLSSTNMTAVYMSEMLYLFGCCDRRVRPLVFALRRWASDVGLTNPSPGRWVTNFSLTLLVIFYLQQARVLPSLDILRQLAGKSDHRISEEGANCTFLRDPAKIKPSDNTNTLEDLLLGFLEYYAAFDFGNQGIALGPGSPVKKRDHSALFIVNPLEPHLNVSQNVSLDEIERLRIACRDAAWDLESCSDRKSSDENWGLLRLYSSDKTAEKMKQLEHLYINPKRRSRLVVSKLFEDEPEQSSRKKVSKDLGKNVVR